MNYAGFYSEDVDYPVIFYFYPASVFSCQVGLAACQIGRSAKIYEKHDR